MSNHQSVWLATTRECSFPPLDRPVEADVAVLGAGITGLTTALMLKNAGLRVAVVEAGRVGGATTGHTTAKVSTQHGLIYSRITDKFGEDGARAYAEANQVGLDTIESIIREHDIDCDWERRPAYAYTEQADTVESIESEVKAAQKAGLPAHLVHETELPWEVEAAVRFDDQAQFHPHCYCMALAKLIDGDGSRVYEHTRAIDVTEGSPCAVETDRFDVYAPFVVLATHLPFLDQGAFFAKCHPEREYAMAIALDEPLPGGMYISADSPTRSVRQHPFGNRELLILAGDSHKTGQGGDTEDHYDALERFARARFKVRSIEYRWSTQDQMSVDGLPYIGKLRRGSDRLYVATGFNKWGMTNGTVAGVLITDQILGRDNPWVDLFDPHRMKPLASAKSFVKENLNVAKRFVADRIAPEQLEIAAPEDLAPGEGRVVLGEGGGQVALSRDDDGTLHALSARCTHLGCLVKWNHAERSWDCPCHGSRFGQDGRVLEGPAVRPLDDRSREAGLREPAPQ